MSNDKTITEQVPMMTDDMVSPAGLPGGEEAWPVPLLHLMQNPDTSEVVAIESIRPADSPRLSGENAEHTSTLGESLSDLPAILVNRRTMRVVDGMHRLSAARQQGASTIRVTFVDVGQDEAFLLAVRANMSHGLPLSLADREAAALRILAWFPSWSDRAIADVVGLAPSTIAATRGRSTDHSTQLNARVGRDGRIRPMSTLDGRLRASEILSVRPDTPLREVAAEAGISLGTAHDVRNRMRRGDHPVPERQRTDEDRVPSGCRRRGLPHRRRREEPVPWSSIRPRLIKDPAIRYATSGQDLLRWLDSHAISGQSWQGLVDVIPPHWTDAIAGVAYSCGDQWYELARMIERRAEDMNGPSEPEFPRRAEDGAA